MDRSPEPARPIHDEGRPELARRGLWHGLSGELTDASWRRGRHPECRVAEVERTALVLLFEGSYVRDVGSRSVVGEPMHVTLYEAGERHRIRHPRGEATRGIRFRPSAELLERAAAAAGAPRRGSRRHRFPALSVPVEPRLAVSLRVLARDLASGLPPDALEVDETLFRYVFSVMTALHGPGRPARTPGGAILLGRLRDLQHRLWAEPGPSERLEDLAAEVGCSTWHLSKAFADLAGMTLSRFVARARLHRAVARILDGADDLTDVALASGYASHSHLSASFRRELGFPPSALRAKGADGVTRRGAGLRRRR